VDRRRGFVVRSVRGILDGHAPAAHDHPESARGSVTTSEESQYTSVPASLPWRRPAKSLPPERSRISSSARVFASVIAARTSSRAYPARGSSTWSSLGRNDTASEQPRKRGGNTHAVRPTVRTARPNIVAGCGRASSPGAGLGSSGSACADVSDPPTTANTSRIATPTAVWTRDPRRSDRAAHAALVQMPLQIKPRIAQASWPRTGASLSVFPLIDQV
jgi:hypothetical protein